VGAGVPAAAALFFDETDALRSQLLDNVLAQMLIFDRRPRR
jgi:hypothetical protein